MATTKRWATQSRCAEQRFYWSTRGREPVKPHLCTPAQDCPKEKCRKYTLMCLVELFKGSDEHLCAVYYWQASQRNFHFIWNPGVVWGTGRGLISAKLQGMWSAHGACSQPNSLFANGCVVSFGGTCQVLQYKLGCDTKLLMENIYFSKTLLIMDHLYIIVHTLLCPCGYVR